MKKTTSKTKFKAQAFKISEMGILKKLYYQIFERQSFRTVKLKNENYLVSINDIAKKTGLLSKDIVDSKNNELNESVISLALESKNFGVSPQMLKNAIEEYGKGQIHYFEHIAETLHLSLYELIEAKKNDNLEEVVNRARLVEEFTGMATHCHLSTRYNGDLFSEILDPDNKKPLSQYNKMNAAYQIAFGIDHIHQMNTTHGDIKPENFFVKFSLNEISDKKNLRVYLSDFGGSIDHEGSKINLQETTSAEYRLDADDKKSVEFYNNKDWNSYKEIEKKADVFAASIVLCSLFTQVKPYFGAPGGRNFKVNEEQLKEQLKENGASEKLSLLLIQGLSKDYKERPDMSTILECVHEEIYQNYPEVAEELSIPV